MTKFWQCRLNLLTLPTLNDKVSAIVEKETDKINIAQLAAPLWTPLTDEQRELLSENISIRRLERDEMLFSEGSTPTHLYYLLRGKITMHRDGLGGQQQIVRMVEPGALFGYASAIAGSNHRSSAIAGSNTAVAQIPISLMFHFIWENSNFAMLFLPDELYRARHGTYRVVFGDPIPPETFDSSKSPAQWAAWVREKVYNLE